MLFLEKPNKNQNCHSLRSFLVLFYSISNRSDIGGVIFITTKKLFIKIFF